MTVAELIERLKEVPPDAIVFVNDSDHYEIVVTDLTVKDGWADEKHENVDLHPGHYYPDPVKLVELE